MLRLVGCSRADEHRLAGLTGDYPARSVAVGRDRYRRQRCPQVIVCMNGAGLRRLLATTAMWRVSRSGRSPGGWDGPRPPSRRTYTTRPARKPGPSSAATKERVAPAAHPRRRATARTTPTSTARPATPEQSEPSGQPSECATQCAPGNTATATCPPHTTGRAPTLAAAARKRSSDSTPATGHPPASSATCLGPGKPRAAARTDT